MLMAPNNKTKYYKAIKDELNDISVDFRSPPAKLKYEKISKAFG